MATRGASSATSSANSGRARPSPARRNSRQPRKAVIIRSRRRRYTVSARIVGNVLEVLVPAGLHAREEADWVERMKKRLLSTNVPSDRQLLVRAIALSKRYFDGDLNPSSVQWSRVQRMRWGSCSPESGEVRLSDRLRGFPRWVIDYVLVHEMAHLRYVSHGTRFWSLVARYPLTERAKGYLIAKGTEED